MKAAFALLLMTVPAQAHDFYSAACCSGNSVTGDCQPIPDASVRPVTGGVQLNLSVGDHFMVTRPHSFTIQQRNIRHAPDGRWHVCLYPSEDHVQCVYGPAMGS